ncbi:MAG: hypothetical protein A2Z25_16710 [Planctomycetes bacterium RBG_16_55_9]|nr:MAG: hypothetical protein A2Z25_16710 [Planctomycetes bacterium RBG_16_55_9]
MCKKLLFLIWLASVVGMGVCLSPAQGQEGLIGYWKLDEASGLAAADSAGGDNNGTLIGANLAWAAGKSAGALSIPGDMTDHRVEIPTTGMSATAGTVAMWGFLADPQPATSGRYFFGHTTQPQWNNRIQIYMQEGTTPSTLLDIGLGGAHAAKTDIVNVPLEQWIHVALTWDSGNYAAYVNGDQVATGTYAGLTAIGPIANIGNDGSNAPYEAFGGLLDEVQLYSRALSAVEILSAMAGEPFPFSSGPSPQDGSVHFDTWVTLSWRPGQFAVSHDIYLGDDFDAVNDANRASEFYWGNQTTLFYVAGFPGYAYPQGLEPGTTYYWRIDEVNDAHPESPWKGDIWSFSIPPKTAYNPSPADGAGAADTAVTLSWTPGFGAKLHTMYFGQDYDTVANAAAGIPVGTTSYNPGALAAEKVYYWRVDEFDGLGTYKGDVWTFTTPGAVGNPQPANGDADVAMATVLIWTPAATAASHQVYLGLDKDAVRSAGTTSPEYKGARTLGAESYDPGLLEANTTYYWRVDGVYNGTPVKGPVWSFTVGAHLLVDDFESYTDNDTAGESIWQSWIDGFGTTDNGAQVGYLLPPYAERTIVHGGAQSMPLLYANQTGKTNSEAVLTLTAQRDWTAAGVGELSLWFRGATANAVEPLYVAISNTAGSPAVAAYDDPSAVAAGTWKEWRIPLATFAGKGINLSNVNTIAIGLGTKSGLTAAGGTGTIYVDDIRLYRP